MLLRIAAATLAVSLLGAPVVATTHPAEELVAEIESLGVSVFFHGEKCAQGFDGVYYPVANKMVICSPLPPHMMSDAVRKTLRHETVHMIQDCNSGGLESETLGNLTSDAQLQTLINMSRLDASQIVNDYREYMNASDYVIRLELEAWSIQEVATEQMLVQAIQKLCL
jgi:hypothetical protein